jgi:hypothetical protein
LINSKTEECKKEREKRKIWDEQMDERKDGRHEQRKQEGQT